MEEVRVAGGPWTVAGDPRERGERGVLVVKCEGFGVAGRGGGGTNGQMEGQR